VPSPTPGCVVDGVWDQPTEECDDLVPNSCSENQVCVGCVCVPEPGPDPLCGNDEQDDGEECGEPAIPSLQCKDPTDKCIDCVCYPKTLGVELTASFDGGANWADPLATIDMSDIHLQATVLGTAEGDIKYQFACGNGQIIPEFTSSNTVESTIGKGGCDYTSDGPGTYTASVTVLRDSLSASNTAQIVVEQLQVELTVAQDETSWDASTSGQDPLSGVDMQAEITNFAGKANPSKQITYAFACGIHGITIVETTTDSSKIVPDVSNKGCIYSPDNTYTPNVNVARDGNTGSDNATVTVTDPGAACSDPSVSNLREIISNQCDGSIAEFLEWDYSDAGNSPPTLQSKYKVEIDDEDTFASPLVYEAEVSSSSTTHAVPLGTIDHDTTYYWRVKAWNTCGDDPYEESAWEDSDTITPAQCPVPNFTWTPDTPEEGEVVDFTNASQCFAIPCTYAWTFSPDGVPATSDQRDPNNPNPEEPYFPTSGSKNVTLQVTDQNSCPCSKTWPVPIGEVTVIPPPEWTEIIPW